MKHAVTGLAAACLALLHMGCSNNDVNPQLPQAPTAELSISHLKDTITYAAPYDRWVIQARFTEADSAAQLRWVNAGEVRCNGRQLTPYEAQYTGSGDTVHLLFAPPDSVNPTLWEVTGKGNVPAFTYTQEGIVPRLINEPPDTIHKSAGYTLNLATDIAGGDQIGLLISTAKLSPATSTSTQAGNITYTPDQLAGYPDNTKAKVLINIVKTNTQDFGVYNVRFNKQLVFQKWVVMAP